MSTDTPHGEARAVTHGVLAIRRGPGANCSSIGSVVDILFGAAVLGGAVYAAIAASLRDRPLRVIGVAHPNEDPSSEKGTS